MSKKKQPQGPKRDRTIVPEFLQHYESLTGVKFEAVNWPEDQQRAGEVIDCEARGVVGDRTVVLAIEHTEVETYDQQLRDGVWFDWANALEKELQGKWPWHVGISLVYSPGTFWPKDLSESIRQWVHANIERVAETGNRRGHDVAIGGVNAIITKWPSDRRAVLFARTSPEGVPDPASLDARMTEALGHKREELRKRRAGGETSLTLLESRDIALISMATWYASFFRVTRKDKHEALSEVWFADTYEGPAGQRSTTYHCFRGAPELMKAANPGNFMFGPEHGAYWSEHASK